MRNRKRPKILHFSELVPEISPKTNFFRNILLNLLHVLCPKQSSPRRIDYEHTYCLRHALENLKINVLFFLLFAPSSGACGFLVKLQNDIVEGGRKIKEENSFELISDVVAHVGKLNSILSFSTSFTQHLRR